MNPRLIFPLLVALAVDPAPASAADAKPISAPATPVTAKPATTAPATTRVDVRPAVVAAPRKDSAVVPPASATLESFRLIADRNIFNPNRTGRRDRSNEEAPPRLDTISLVGTMESDKGLRAFFDGSDRTYRKALRVGESVDKFKVTQIAPTTVDLEQDGKPLSVRVGQQLRRPEGADWAVVGEDVLRQEAQARAAAETGRIDPAAPMAVPSGASDTLRKLMEARNKQLKP